MREKVLLLAAVAVIAAVGSVVVTQADGTEPAQAAKAGPPPIHEPFTVLPCPSNPTSTPDLEGCLEHQILRTDRTIENLNSSIFSLIGPDNVHLPRDFIAAHRAWLAYRKADCLAVSEQYEGGTLSPVAYAECVVKRNDQRIKDLRAFRHDLTPH